MLPRHIEQSFASSLETKGTIPVLFIIPPLCAPLFAVIETYLIDTSKQSLCQ